MQLWEHCRIQEAAIVKSGAGYDYKMKHHVQMNFICNFSISNIYERMNEYIKAIINE